MFKNPHPLLLFAKILAGKFSNREQANLNPRLFAHINIYFQPLDWKIFKGPAFYSEQSYDYDPWSPYRQAFHRLDINNKLIIVENFIIQEPIKFAGAGAHPNLLRDIKPTDYKLRKGCAMQFEEVKAGHYIGKIQPGKMCLIPRDGKITYLKSEVEINGDNWISLDQGFDIKTDKHVWGSLNGAMNFIRLESFSSLINAEWISRDNEKLNLNPT